MGPSPLLLSHQGSSPGMRWDVSRVKSITVRQWDAATAWSFALQPGCSHRRDGCVAGHSQLSLPTGSMMEGKVGREAANRGEKKINKRCSAVLKCQMTSFQNISECETQSDLETKMRKLHQNSECYLNLKIQFIIPTWLAKGKPAMAWHARKAHASKPRLRVSSVLPDYMSPLKRSINITV